MAETSVVLKNSWPICLIAIGLGLILFQLLLQNSQFLKLHLEFSLSGAHLGMRLPSLVLLTLLNLTCWWNIFRTLIIGSKFGFRRNFSSFHACDSTTTSNSAGHLLLFNFQLITISGIVWHLILFSFRFSARSGRSNRLWSHLGTHLALYRAYFRIIYSHTVSLLGSTRLLILLRTQLGRSRTLCSIFDDVLIIV